MIMHYKKFTDSEPYSTTIDPYCLKLFHQRWYLLGRSERKNGVMAIYALDRITKLTETDQSIQIDNDFDVSTFFNYYFGVFIGEKAKPTRIVLRAYGKMTSLLRTLPLHHSQKEIAKTDTFSDFEYYLIPTFDFRQAILKEGHDLEVLKPLSLRKKIHEELIYTLKRYRKKE